ncbi:MAG TPA: SPOR domain-containing protein, partial [Saliniramus sp.]|nr:SPOR domain-containing protein [Saliniramus sp.]
GPIEAFATLSAPAPDETLDEDSVAPDAVVTRSEQTVASEPEKEPETKQVAALVVPPTKPATEPKKQSDAATGSSTQFVIQIAAAVNERAAQELLERARKRVGKPLEKAEPFVERVALKRSTVYRARFGGFEAAGDARSACRLLEQAGFDCFQARTAPLSG